MTPEEAVILARYVKAMCPQQRLDEYTADAWYDVLAPYPLEDARAAVARHVTAGHSFISVGEIITEIRRARHDRLEQHTEAEPPTDGTDPAAYRAALHAERRAIADGRRDPSGVPALPPGSSQPPTGRVRALLAAAGRPLLTPREGVVNPLAVPCRICQAQPGRSCVYGAKRRRRADPHPTRLDDARRAAAGLPPADPEATRREEEQRRAASHAALQRLDAEHQHEPDQPTTDPTTGDT